jgi:hypothetical protein
MKRPCAWSSKAVGAASTLRQRDVICVRRTGEVWLFAALRSLLVTSFGNETK